jgi:hypothetical protein
MTNKSNISNTLVRVSINHSQTKIKTYQILNNSQ